MTISKLLHKIENRCKKMRLQPIHVYDLHHVSATFEADSMSRGDWIQIDEFKSKILSLRQSGVEFISLHDAHVKISNDIFRCRKYMVLTFDDGYASLKEILPWLDEQHIPVTLFINGKYLDGKSYRKNPQERYLTKKELDEICEEYPLLTIGSHGWEHINVKDMTNEEFEASVEKNLSLLVIYPCYCPYYAYTYGMHTEASDEILKKKNLIPVYVDGVKNFNESSCIHRELL